MDLENKGKPSGAAGIPNNKRLQQSITGSGVITLGAHNAKNLNDAKISGKSAHLNYFIRGNKRISISQFS